MRKIKKSQILKEVDLKIKRSERIEEICRKQCKLNGIEPDVLVCKHMPQLLNYPYMAGFIVPEPMFQMKAWHLYEDIVIQTLDLIEYQGC